MASVKKECIKFGVGTIHGATYNTRIMKYEVHLLNVKRSLQLTRSLHLKTAMPFAYSLQKTYTINEHN